MKHIASHTVRQITELEFLIEKSQHAFVSEERDRETVICKCRCTYSDDVKKRRCFTQNNVIYFYLVLR